MFVGILKDRNINEKRVSIVPQDVQRIKKLGAEVIVESSSGEEAGFSDSEYKDAGAEVGDREEVLSKADLILKVRILSAEGEDFLKGAERYRGKTLVGMAEPFSLSEEEIKIIEEGEITAFSLELIPRITRAQSMDVLSSMATVAGYRAVIIASNLLPKMFPMLMTAAGTIIPARVFVIGAGVAGLQAIATARRLGAVVEAYDIRPAVKEQVESLGAKFVELGLETEEAETKSGYAKEMGEEFYRRQREVMADVISTSDVVISTAAVPGKRAPILITREMVALMKKGSVIVDLAAERGGNCELTEPGKVIEVNGVKIAGPLNLPADLPADSSRLLSRNYTNFLGLIIKEGELHLNQDDEIISETLLFDKGRLVNKRIKEYLGVS
jgi:NAD(P) transhydrogenase subunit alpha